MKQELQKELIKVKQKDREWLDSHGGPDVVQTRLFRGWV